jgi:hypothetical protein
LRWARAWVLGGSSTALSVGGHLLGGGHVEPVLVALLTALAAGVGYAWLRRERGLIPLVGAVIASQVLTHVALSAGHPHGASMVMAHAAAAVALACFLRWGEARVFAAARRRYLRWLVALRLAQAGRIAVRPWNPGVPATSAVGGQSWIHRAVQGRAPPVAASC